MYIPSLLLNNGLNNAISASGGNVVGFFESGSELYKYHKFTSTGSSQFIINSGSSTDVKLFIVAGGGGGGVGSNSVFTNGGGGGGAGGLVYTTVRLGKGEYDLYVGKGGIRNTSGENSWFTLNYEPSNYNGYFPTPFQLTAEGGGNGGAGDYNAIAPNIIPDNGGSGGGGVHFEKDNVIIGEPNIDVSYSGGDGRLPQGFDGGNPSAFGTYIEGAGGGGAGGVGLNPIGNSAPNASSKGGNGLSFNVDGYTRYYSGGGSGYGEGYYAGNSTDATGSSYYGGGGKGGSDYVGAGTEVNGKNGIIVIYYNTPRTDDCELVQFTPGSGTQTATYTDCDGNPVTESIDVQTSFCSQTGTSRGLTGGGSTISVIGSC